jgi:predicted phage terminase large subunit-like protein
VTLAAPDLGAALLSGFDRGLGLPPEQDTRFPTPLDVAQRLDRKFKATPAIQLINDALVWAEQTPDARLIVTMPPQEGKSSLVTRYGSLWALLRDPSRRVALTSYGDRLARRWGRAIRADIRTNSGYQGMLDLGLRISQDARASDEWELAGGGGGIYTAGVRSAITGRPVDWLVIDDPHKDRKDADSLILREDVWDWWESSASARLAPGAPVTLVLTRWHNDDLAGRLMREQPGVWRLVHIPAQADPHLIDPDPLGRDPGEYMVSARGRSLENWESRKRDAGDEWEPLYQGNPAAPGGDVFEVDRIRYWHPARDRGTITTTRTWPLAQCWRFATVDTASSKSTSADYTVVGAWAIPPDGHLVLLDLARERVPIHRQIELARPLVERWNLDITYVEAGMKGTQLVRELLGQGWQVDDLIADKSKQLRAGPLARRIREGRVWIPSEHAWLQEVLKELREFPNSRHDDIVDVFAYAARANWSEWVIPQSGLPAPAKVRPGGADAVIPDPMSVEF